jgi:hypothetical protein
MKKYIYFLQIALITIMLTGCLYPERNLTKNQVPNEQQVQMVQQAVDNYQKSTGVLPIKTRDMATPVYEKYPIDFGKIAPQYIQEPPGNSYENGGVYIYVLVDVEVDPQVKLIDLLTINKVQDLQLRVDMYRREHQYPPIQTVLADGRYLLDYEKLDYDEAPSVRSPFTGNNLPMIIDNDAKVFVDYSIDLYQYMQEEDVQLNKGDDIRHIMVNNSFFVPIKSVPYTIENDEPVFLVK